MNAALTATNNQRIFRLAKADRHQFTILDQRTVQAEELTPEAHSLIVRMTGHPDNWEFSAARLAKIIGWSKNTVLKYLNELIAAGYVVRQWVRGVNGYCFAKVVYLVAEVPECMPNWAKTKRSTPQPEAKISTSQNLTTKDFTTKNLGHISKINSTQNLNNIYNLSSQVADVVIFNNTEFQPELEDFWLDPAPAKINGTQELGTKIQASKQAIGEKNIPAACDKIQLKETQQPEPPPPRMAKPNPKSTLSAIGETIGHIKQSIQSAMTAATAVPDTTEQQQQPKQPSKPRLDAPERLEYKNKLAGIGVHLDTVEWIIRQIDPQERREAVENAIAWVRENTWIKQPSAAFVEAVRERRQSSQTRDVELRQLMDANKTEAQQFKDWYDWAKAEKLVDYSQGDRQHYALVVLTDGTVLPWREAKEKLDPLLQ